MQAKIIRVFPRRTSMTPQDPYAFIGDPPMWRPEADEVHVSCTFTWDVKEARRLTEAWHQYYPFVKLGGPAIGGTDNSFTPGQYIKYGVTFTSRGCNNHCPWCLTPFYEGSLREILYFSPGHTIQDNNILQCSPGHISRVFEMLKTQKKPAVFSGGLESRLVTFQFADMLKEIRVDHVFLAADSDPALERLEYATRKLSFLGRKKLRCYVMIGYNETIKQAEARLRAVWEIGCLPFAQLFQPPDPFIKYFSDWKALARTFSRPAAMYSIMPRDISPICHNHKHQIGK